MLYGAGQVIGYFNEDWYLLGGLGDIGNDIVSFRLVVGENTEIFKDGMPYCGDISYRPLFVVTGGAA